MTALAAAVDALPYALRTEFDILRGSQLGSLQTEEERDEVFARLQAVTAELASLPPPIRALDPTASAVATDDELDALDPCWRDRWALEDEEWHIERAIVDSLARLGPYPPWSDLLTGKRAQSTSQAKDKSGRRVPALEVVREIMLRGLVEYLREKSGRPTADQLCAVITSKRLRNGQGLHPKTLSRWLGTHGVTYDAELATLLPLARRRQSIERAHQPARPNLQAR